MNEVETVRYVHSDRSWIAALCGGLAGFVLGATFMGVLSLMLWTMRSQLAPAPATADTSSQAAAEQRRSEDSSQARTVTADALSDDLHTSDEPPRTTSRFTARPKNDESETSEGATDVATSEAESTPEMPEHGPMSKATIEAYRLPGAEPE